MSAITLSLREPLPLPVDASVLRPGIGPAELTDLPLYLNGERRTVGDLFHIAGDDPQRLVIAGETIRRLDGLSSAMSGGELIIEGDAGAWLGRGMSGGTIRVAGDCGDHAGSAMSGGAIHIDGSAGARLGSAAIGERIGMRGGVIHVRGDAGDYVATRLRRGIVVIDGDAGRGAADSMIAGTLVIGGRVGAEPGRGMRRGTLLLRHADTLPWTFHDSGRRNLAWLALLRTELASLNSPAARFDLRVRRYLGDRAAAGLGEVLLVEG